MPKKFFFLPFLIFSAVSIQAQEDVEKLLFAIQNDQNILIQDYKIKATDVDYLLYSFEDHLAQFDRRKRNISYFYLQRFSFDFEDFESKSKVLHFFVKNGLKDSDPGNRKAVIELLYAIPLDCYTNAIKSLLASYVVSKEEPFVDLVRLVGWANIFEIKEFLLNTVSNEEFSNKEKWAIRLALARLGNDESVRYCMQVFRKAGMNDLVIQSLVPDIIYLNKKEGIDYLLMQILEDEKLCSSPNPDAEININCAYRLIEAVAPVIVDFPIEIDASGDLLVDDYEAALYKVRDWISNNYHSYQIKG